MSKIKLEGNASGSGTLTISAPNTNTDRTLTLPDGAGEILLSDGDGSSLTGVGISEIDCWRLNNNFSCTAYSWADVNNYWERQDVSGDALSYLGTGMSQSSGVFTFPSTGHWLVIAGAQFFSSTFSELNGIRFLNTINNSNYDDAVVSFDDSKDTSVNRSITASMVIDVTDTSQVKTKMQCYSYSASNVLSADTGNNRTYINFIKLTDT